MHLHRFKRTNRSLLIRLPNAIKCICIASFTLIFISAQSQNIGNEKVVLQLNWKCQFQFAGYYAALEKGYYNEAGLTVEIKEPGNAISVIPDVIKGVANYGVGNSELLIHYMKGDPVVVLACIMQNSPTALLVKSVSKIFTPKDLIGKTIESDIDHSGIDIKAMLSKEEVSSDSFNSISSTYSLNNLLANKVDAIEVYTTNEPYFLDKFGIPYRLILPRNYGINFYSECLFTSKDEIRKHHERVKKFRDASIKGWKYALDHPDEIANIIQSKYHSTKTIEHLLLEAEEMQRLINPGFIEVGHSNKERWLNIVEILSQQNLIKKYRNIDDFLYNPDDINDLKLLKILTAIIIGLLIGLSTLGFYTIKFRKIISINHSKVKILSNRDELQKNEIKRLTSELNKIKEKFYKAYSDKTTEL